MAIGVTDRGTVQTTQGGSITLSNTSSAFSPAASTILVVGVSCQVRNDSGATTDVVYSLSDNIGDTGGGSWGKRASCVRGSQPNGVYFEHVELWTRVLGTSPGASKTVTASATYNSGSNSTTGDGWFASHFYEVSGQDTTTPVGLTASPSPVTTGTTFNTDLGGVPGSTSCVFGVMQDDGDGTTGRITQPSGWTEDDELNASVFVASFEWAHINGGSVQSPQWSTMTSGDRLLGCAVEIVALSSGTNLDVPLLQPLPTQTVWRM